jgi:hypothetical protein
MPFYILDMGHKMYTLGKCIEKELAKDENHVIVYLSDMPTLLCVEELTEDQFLDHFKNTNQNASK